MKNKFLTRWGVKKNCKILALKPDIALDDKKMKKTANKKRKKWRKIYKSFSHTITWSEKYHIFILIL